MVVCATPNRAHLSGGMTRTARDTNVLVALQSDRSEAIRMDRLQANMVFRAALMPCEHLFQSGGTFICLHVSANNFRLVCLYLWIFLAKRRSSLDFNQEDREGVVHAVSGRVNRQGRAVKDGDSGCSASVHEAERRRRKAAVVNMFCVLLLCRGAVRGGDGGLCEVAITGGGGGN